MLDILLNRYKEKQKFKDKILGALNMHYDLVDKDGVARDYATAGNLYSYLALALNQSNNTWFQQSVKELLIEEDIINPVEVYGRVWLKGLKAKDPSADNQIAKKVIEQHYKDRSAYRARQRAHQLNSQPGTK